MNVIKQCNSQDWLNEIGLKNHFEFVVQDTFVDRLADALAIKSVSAWQEQKYRDEIVKMITYVKDVGLGILPCMIQAYK